MSFGTNDINSIIDCSDDDDVLRTDNEEVEDNEDIVNQILDELGDDNDNHNDNHNNLNDVYNTNNFNTEEVDLGNFNNMDNNHNHNDINHNHIDNQSYNNIHNNDYNNNSMFSNRLNDDINFKEHIRQRKPSNKKKEIDKKKNEDMNNSWCSFIPSNILSNILLYKDYILILIICLVTNNPLVHKQMMNIGIFNTENKLNIFAYLFQTLLFVIIYFIINFVVSFI